MTQIEERTLGELTIRIDRSMCVGFGHCVDEAEQAFRLVDDDPVSFNEPERVDRERLLAACAACPVGALSAVTATGERLV
jgi:ferredoxin